jgi:hypothetical protein
MQEKPKLTPFQIGTKVLNIINSLNAEKKNNAKSWMNFLSDPSFK